MKSKKSIKAYCIKCRKHTQHKVAIAKIGGRNKTHPMSHGSRKRMRLRGLDRGYGNQGRTSKGAVSSWKRSGAKISKKVNLKLTCEVCKKSQIRNMGRAKRIELIQ